MYNFNYDKGNIVGRVSLETSLKPFKNFDYGEIKKVCHTMFKGWEKLTDKAESIAVMLWTADGSEILEYSGDLSQSFDYCDLIGIVIRQNFLPTLTKKRTTSMFAPCFITASARL